MLFSLEEYCSRQNPIDVASLNDPTTRQFLLELNLPSIHPFCDHAPSFFYQEDIPPMGTLNQKFDGHESSLEIAITLWYMVAPPFLAMAELWLRLFAGALGPIGTMYMGLKNNIAGSDFFAITTLKKSIRSSDTRANNNNNVNYSRWNASVWIFLTVASSSIVMTDTLSCLENGPVYGGFLFVASVVVSIQTCYRQNLRVAAVTVFAIVLLSISLIWDVDGNGNDILVFGNKIDQVNIREGLYYDQSNEYISSIVANWPERYRLYDKAHGSTPWLPTGDGRTGIPFLINHLPNPDWNRVFLEIDDEEKEYLALDIAFPPSGHSFHNPIYLVLHGLNGGSNEEYVRDLTFRRTREENSTVIVMVARGLMDLPIRRWNLFHGARTSDAHKAALAVRNALGDNQVLIGVGYSMGAIILSNYVANSGESCALDGAVAISGGLDMRYQEHFFRARRLWQPMLAETLRDDFLLGKWGYRVKERLNHKDFLGMMRASHVTEIDGFALVPYHGFDSLDHYYREMSALGDIPHDSEDMIPLENQGKIHNVSIPLAVVHAFDDPLVTWRATCHNSGFMHPENLVKSGNGNLMLLLTKAGGHVGWPLGVIPTIDKWKWMSDVAMSFAEAASKAKAERTTRIINTSAGHLSSNAELAG